MTRGHIPGVLVDADVWFSRTRRDWFGILYTCQDVPPFQAFWAEDILAELIANLRDTFPNWNGRRIATVRDRLAGTFEAGRVLEYEIDGSYQGIDEGDAHVHAAAIACGAQYLVTCNSKDFRWDENSSPYEVVHPDEFLTLVDDSAPALVRRATQDMVGYWFGKRQSAELPQHLLKADCPGFAERVRQHLQAMAGQANFRAGSGGPSPSH